jgi:ribosome maturation factor RimP
MSPLFIYLIFFSMVKKEVEDKLSAWVEELLEGSEFYLLEIKVLPRERIIVLADGMNGIPIAKCSEISRHIGDLVEETELITHAYTLEVSSPGLDKPLVDIRQYQKNIGNEFDVWLTDSSYHNGILKAVADGNITFEMKKKIDKKKVELVETHLTLDQIQQAKVKITF